MAQALVDAALTYARAGLRVHPCRPQDKRPLARWGTAATTDEAKVRVFWRRWPDALIAVCTGSGLVVVDIDPRNGGEYDAELARTLTATTRGGGWHHWHYSDTPLGNAVGIVPGVDIRGDGGYVIAPPSPGWAWVDADRKILPLPDWVRDEAQSRRAANRQGGGFEPAQPGSIHEGYRHDYMVSFAGWAIRAFDIDDGDELAGHCLEEYRRACSPADAPHANIIRIAKSILAKHRRA